MKTCSRCQLTKDADQFPKHRETKDRLDVYCRACKVAVATAWRKENRQRYNESRKALRNSQSPRVRQIREINEGLMTKYGINLSQYEALFKQQGGVCAICGHPSKRRLCVDHDHETGTVRALLCGHCNSGLGHFKDDPALIRIALAYLERHRDGDGVQRGDDPSGLASNTPMGLLEI